MEKKHFDTYLESHIREHEAIRDLAHKIHSAVNQHYDKSLPYSVHLDSVSDYVKRHAWEICDNDDDILPILFGAYFHDSIEDARLTYNNVLHLASKFFDEHHARLATEIVYALTNEKGRTRAERANNRYYEGIRTTPYAAMCKYADRLANVSYSLGHNSQHNDTMRHIYASEYPHFAAALTIGGDADPRYTVPPSMVAELENMLKS